MIIQSTSSQWICKCAISCVNMITMIIRRGLDYRSDLWKTGDAYHSWKHTFMLFRNSCGNVFFVVCTKSSIWKIPADTVLLCFNVHQCVPRNNGAHLDPQCDVSANWWIEYTSPIDGWFGTCFRLGWLCSKKTFAHWSTLPRWRIIAASFLHITIY